MYARLPAETLRDAFAPVDALVNEVVFRPTPDELILHAARGDRTASVTVTLPPTLFDAYALSEFDMDAPDNYAFGINVQRPTRLLQHLSHTGSLTMTGPPRTNRFKISMNEGGSIYCTPLIDPSTIYQRSQTTPDQRLPTTFAIPSDSALLQRSLAAADLCGETLNIETQESDPEIRLAATGTLDDMYSLFTSDKLHAYYGGPTTATYDVDKLRKMYDVLHVRTDRLQFTINSDATLLLTATHTDTDTTTRYVLASCESTE